MASWALTASLPRDRFTPGEPVVVTARLRWTGKGVVEAPALGAGALIVIASRDGAPPVEERTPPPERGSARAHARHLREGATLEEPIDLAGTLELEAGRFEVVLALAFDPKVRSAPVRFTIEPIALRSALVAPVGASGEGVRFVLRAEDTRLVLTKPTLGGRVTLDLATPPGSAQLAIATAPEASAAPRPWVLLHENDRLGRLFVHDKGVERLDPVPLEGALAGACEGAARGSAPDGRSLPDLHVLLVAPGALVGATFSALSGGPRVERQTLAAPPLGTALVPFSGDQRLAI